MIDRLQFLSTALFALRLNRVRAFLTAFIISLGVCSLICMMTAVEVLKESFSDNFSLMGSNTYSLSNSRLSFSNRRNRDKSKPWPRITMREAQALKDELKGTSVVSVYRDATGTAVIGYKSQKTSPRIRVVGTDANYLDISGIKLDEGRGFTETEESYGVGVVILGASLKKDLFGLSNALGKSVSIGPGKYTVVGVAKEKGNSMGFSPDNQAFIPLNKAQTAFPQPKASFKVGIKEASIEQLKPSIERATGLFRIIRKIRPQEDINFSVTTSDSLAQVLIGNLKILSIVAIIVSLITILAAAIGLMNIMLVSVTERIREIGVRMAVGASSQNIKKQFLTEATAISVLGGLGGILLGLLLGNMVGAFIGGHFAVPWLWTSIGIAVCVAVGMSAGYYPASKAANLDPINALSHE